MNGISAFIKAASKKSLGPSSIWGCSEEELPWTRKRTFTRKSACWCLMWDLPASRAVTNEYLWFISYSAPGVLLQQPKCALLSHSVESDSLWPHEPARLLCPWGFPGKSPGVGFHELLQGMFPSQRSNSDLPVDSLPSEPPGKPKTTGLGSLSLLQGIFLTQEYNRGLLHCRWIIYQLSYEGSPDRQRQYQLAWSFKWALRINKPYSDL